MLENAVQYPDLDEIVQKSERKTVYKKLVRRSKLDRRTQILQVVLQMLQEDDYKQVSMSRIAEKVGISEAAIYRNYRNKSAIFSAVSAFESRGSSSRPARSMSVTLLVSTPNPAPASRSEFRTMKSKFLRWSFPSALASS